MNMVFKLFVKTLMD